MLARFGVSAERPARHMREYSTCLAPLLAGKRGRDAGERYRVSLQLGQPGADPPTVLLAALGRRCRALAGACGGRRGDLARLASRYLSRSLIPRLREARARPDGGAPDRLRPPCPR